jgi:general secretion pathway protein I
MPEDTPGRAGEDGFTLIEIMVALAVFSLAVLALLRLESATIRGAGILETSVAAAMVAQNVAADAMTTAQPPSAGKTGGSEVNGGRTWAWTRSVGSIGDGQVIRIDVAVSDPRGGAVLARAAMVRTRVQAP